MNLSYFDLCRSAPALSGGGTLCNEYYRRKKGKGKKENQMGYFHSVPPCFVRRLTKFQTLHYNGCEPSYYHMIRQYGTNYSIILSNYEIFYFTPLKCIILSINIALSVTHSSNLGFIIGIIY